MWSKSAFILTFTLLLSSTAIGVVSSAPAQERIGGQVAGQHLIDHAPPAYPPLAKTARIQGDVVLDVIIGTDGTVESIKAVSGHPLLIRAAMDAVQQWRYKPFMVNGKAVRVSTEVKVSFQLDETAGGAQAVAQPEAPAPTGSHADVGKQTRVDSGKQAIAQQAVEPRSCPPGTKLREDTKQGKPFVQCVLTNPVTIAGVAKTDCLKWSGNRWSDDFVSCEDPASMVVFKLPQTAFGTSGGWVSGIGQFFDEAERRKQARKTVQSMRPYLGKSQAAVKAMLQARGFMPWSCEPRDCAPWEHCVLCDTLKNGPVRLLLFFTVQRVVSDRDTQLTHTEKTDKLYRIEGQSWGMVLSCNEDGCSESGNDAYK